MFMKIVQGIIPGAACVIAWIFNVFSTTKDGYLK